MTMSIPTVLIDFVYFDCVHFHMYTGRMVKKFVLECLRSESGSYPKQILLTFQLFIIEKHQHFHMCYFYHISDIYFRFAWILVCLIIMRFQLYYAQIRYNVHFCLCRPFMNIYCDMRENS